MGMKVLVRVIYFPINFMGKSSIRLTQDENIKKRKRVLCLNFDRKLDLGGNDVKIVKEGV
jgi:hypothetical protein